MNSHLRTMSKERLNELVLLDIKKLLNKINYNNFINNFT